MQLLVRLARVGIRVGDGSIQTGVRESMAHVGRALPAPLYRCVQRGLTWITGKALPDQRPLVTLGAWTHVLLTSLTLACGVALAAAAVVRGGAFWLALPLGWLLSVHATRKFFLVICHAGIHDVFSTRPWVNRAFVDMTSLLIFTMPYEQFRQEHAIDHHARYFSGEGDPDATVLYSIGLRPGRSLEALWLAVGAALINPLFHARYVVARARANFVKAKPWRRALAWVCYPALGYAVYRGNLGGVFLAAWVIPVTVGFQMAALVTFAGEHKWFHLQDDAQSRVNWLQEQTAARFMGEPYPARGAGRTWAAHALAVMGWWLRLAVWFVPLRLLVVPGDMPVHDYHHSNPRGDWTNTLYVRPRWIAQKAPSHSETWGLCAAINHALRPMSLYDADYLAERAPLFEERVTS